MSGGPMVVVFLHGHGDRPDPYVLLASRFLPAGHELVAPAGPVARADGTFAWFEAGPDGGPDPAQLDAALVTLSAIVDDACRAFGTTADRVVVGGFSQGGAMALAWALQRGSLGRGRTPRVAGIFCVSGWLPDAEGLALDVATPVDTVPFLVAHGAEDEAVPLPLGRGVVRVLERHGWSVTFVGDDQGHEMDPFADDLRTWLTDLH